ncbi:MAG: phosphoribosylanthranilate isomerase [Clostridia bacterium]|nr:phosphoribosylanthranilate isomerase [Clostridia bacterium]
MSKVKICGLKRPEDISFVNKYLPEYVGFVFAKSKRQVDAGLVAQLVKNLDPRIKKAGVFVNEDVGRIISTVKECGLNIVQVHGDETVETVALLKEELKKTSNGQVEIWKAVRVKDAASLKGVEEYKVNHILLDAFVEGSYGGAGKTFDWKLASEASKYGKLILAGGLTIENVFEAIKTASPYCVDVSSGVETDGFKDEMKIRDFILRVRNYN